MDFMALINDPRVIAGIAVVVAAIGGFYIKKLKIGSLPMDAVGQVLVSILKGIESQTPEGTTADSMLDAFIPELEKQFGPQAKVVVAQIKSDLGNV